MAQAASKRLVTEATLPELVQDILGAFIYAGTNISVYYNDAANTFTISSSTDPEVVRDTIAQAITGTGLVYVTSDDNADTITVGLSNAANDPVAATAGLRTLGTGSQQAAAGNDTRIVGAAQRVLTKRVVTTSYTLVTADLVDVVIHSTASAATTITVPTGLTAEISIPWRQWGAGQLTFAAGSGATLVSRGNATKSSGQYAGGTLTAIDSTTWLLEGDITT